MTPNSFKKLILHEADPAVSLYMPLHKKGSKDVREDRIRYKNLLSDVEEELQKIGMKATEIASFLDEASALNVERNSSTGLAVFISPRHFSYYKIPMPVQEQVVVGTHFHTKPLMPLIAKNQRFFILSLSKHNVDLFEATGEHIHQIYPPELPESMGEALWYKDVEKHRQFHTNTGVSRGKHGGMMNHGHAQWKDKGKEYIKKYFRTVNNAIHPVIRDTGAPLVVSVDTGLFPIYQEANTYPHLIAEPISQNPEGVRAEELHVQAWPLVKKHIEKEKQEKLDSYRGLLDTNRIKTSPEQIIQDAYDGIVDTLFIEEHTNIWGTYDHRSREMRIEKSHTPENDDLLNSASQQVYIHGGNVYMLPHDKMPSETGSAEIARYAH